MLSPHRFVTAALLIATTAFAQTPATQPSGTKLTSDVVYRADTSSDVLTKAGKLDIYAPATQPAIATIVWFHGGGMTAGDKSEAKAFAGVLNNAGIAIISANYRLSSKAVHYPAYVEDAAAVVAWTAAHAKDYGLNADNVFIGGYSAGGYLACTLGTDARWLSAVGHTPAELRGIIAVSPQVFTHYTIRAERGIADPEHTPWIDDAAPVFHASADTPPIKLFDGEHDTATRPEEITYFISILKLKKQPDASLTTIPGRTHGTMMNHVNEASDPVAGETIAFVRSHVKK